MTTDDPHAHLSACVGCGERIYVVDGTLVAASSHEPECPGHPEGHRRPGDRPTQETSSSDEITFGPIRVSFEYIGEGYHGDYDEKNPEDEALLRLDVLVAAESGYGGEPTDDPAWLYPDQGSICTQVPYDTPPAERARLLRQAAAYLLLIVESGGSVKHAMDRLSRLPHFLDTWNN